MGSKFKAEEVLAKALGELDAGTDWKKLIDELDVPSSIYREGGKVDKSMEIAREAFTWATSECLEKGIEAGIGGAGCGRSRSEAAGCAEDLSDYSKAVLGLADNIGRRGKTILDGKGVDCSWPSKREWENLKLASEPVSDEKALVWVRIFSRLLGVKAEVGRDEDGKARIEVPVSSVVLSAVAAGISHRSVRCEMEVANTMHRLYGNLLKKCFTADRRAAGLERGKVEAWLDGLGDQNLRAEVVRVAAERSGAAKKAAQLREELNDERATRAKVQCDLEEARREVVAAKAATARDGDDPVVVIDLRNAVDKLDRELKAAYSQLDAAQKRVIELERAAG